MSAATALPSATGRRRTVLVVGLVLGAIAIAAWAMDVWLAMRLRVIAIDTFEHSDPSHPQLMMDGEEALKQYPPLRIAGFLRFPSAQIRTVACLSLGDRFPDRDPSRWVGVPTKLLAVATTDSDLVVRNCARAALGAVPCIPAEDADSMFVFAERSQWNDDNKRSLCVGLVENSCKSNPHLLPRAVALYVRRFDSANIDVQWTAFRQLVSLAPDAPETLTAFKGLMGAGDPHKIGGYGGRAMFNRYPELIDEFKAGNSVQRTLLLSIAADDVRNAFQKPHGADPALSKAQLERLEPFAISVITTTDDAKVHDAAMRFLLGEWADREWLATSKTGHDAPVVKACRHMLDSFPGRHDDACIDILLQAAETLRPDDADRLAAAFIRMFEQVERKYSGKGTRVYISRADEFQRRLNRAAILKERPAVKKYLERRDALIHRNLLAPSDHGVQTLKGRQP